MKYVDWVERVFETTLGAAKAPMGYAELANIAEQLGHGRPTWDDFARREHGALDGLLDALTDLAIAGVELPNVGHATVTQDARDVALTGLRRYLWPAAFADPLDDDSAKLLAVTVGACERQQDTYAVLVEHPLRVMCEQAGIATDEYDSANRAMEVFANLKAKGLLRHHLGGLDADVWPTYLGIVRATERDEVEWLERLPGLIEDWETTTVEFKRQLDLETPAGKRTLVRSVLALATTMTSRPRYLVVGFDPASHAFASQVDPAKLTQDRVEDILNAYTEPVPQVRVRTIGWVGLVGIIEVLRDPRDIPYRVARALEDLVPGQVLVRHSSHIEPPTAAEQVALDQEGSRARGEE